jgi:pimeloyl-ACP methyl ester carboxylesterase
VPVVDVGGVRLNYMQLASESREEPEDLVMVHGLATNMAFWYPHVAAELCGHGRVTLYDLRGHGRSGMTNSGYTPADMAEDLLKLLDRLCIERAHFIAHSFGGIVALNLASRSPERFSSLLLADTHIGAVRKTRGNRAWTRVEHFQAILNRLGIELDAQDPYFGYRLLKVIAGLQLRNEEIPQELQELVNPMAGASASRTASQWFKLTSETQAERELMDDDGLSLEGLRELRFPILAMYGEHSPAMSTGEQLLDVWTHAHFRRVRGAGHFFPVSRPAELIQSHRELRNAGAVRRRKGDEENRSHFRSERMRSSGEDWFFDTREGVERGPFVGIEEANEALAEYIAGARGKL